jgi:peroxiredoxin
VKRSLVNKFLLLVLLELTLISAFSENKKIALKVGEKAPDFTILDPSGKSVSLSALRGKLVLLDFWASWCGYCKIANAEFIPIYNTYKSQGFEIFSVSMDIKKEAWVAAIKNQNLLWPYHGSELKGWDDSKLSEIYGVESLPATFLIDENGYIIDTDLDDFDLEKKLNWYYNEQIHFYPHVAVSKIYFTAKAKYQIEDLHGNVLLKGKDIEADISSLTAGEYKIVYEDKTDKLIKRNNTHAPITFFPERVDDKVTMSHEAEYTVYNHRGRPVKRGKTVFIEMADLPTGVYYLCIEGNIHRIFKK